MHNGNFKIKDHLTTSCPRDNFSLGRQNQYLQISLRQTAFQRRCTHTQHEAQVKADNTEDPQTSLFLQKTSLNGHLALLPLSQLVLTYFPNAHITTCFINHMHIT